MSKGLPAGLIQAAGLLLLPATLFFYYQALSIVAQKDYVGALLAVGMGTALLRAQAELQRAAMAARASDEAPADVEREAPLG
jgi:hypothetical protein